MSLNELTLKVLLLGDTSKIFFESDRTIPFVDSNSLDFRCGENQFNGKICQ
jgi:hypothetical protein